MTAPLIATLREDHDNARRLLDLLLHEANLFAAGEDADFDIIESVIDYFRGYPDSYHHPVEDRILVRLKMVDADKSGPVDDLLHQHARLRESLEGVLADLENMRIELEMPRERMVDHIKGFALAYRAHMDSEEAAFFPLAETLLGADDWRAIADDMTAHHDPLFAGKEGCDGLRKRLLAADARS